MNKVQIYKICIGRTCVLSVGLCTNLGDIFKTLFGAAKADFPWLNMDKVNLGHYSAGTTDLNWINFEVDPGLIIPDDYIQVLSLGEMLNIIDR